VAVSIDTMKAEVATRALAAGAAIVNDVWGLQRDPDMAGVVASHNVPVEGTHNRDAVAPALDILADIEDFFSRYLVIAWIAGMSRDRIVLDPGIGFGKTPEQSLTAIAGLHRLRDFGLPLLMGLSRKRFINAVVPSAPQDRLGGSIASALLAVLDGAAIVRGHDVAETVQALRVGAAVRAARRSACRGAVMAEALLGLGGNVGDVRTTLDRATSAMCEGTDVRLIAQSSDYATPPWGVEDQPAFVNRCVAVETKLTPRALLDRALAVERTL